MGKFPLNILKLFLFFKILSFDQSHTFSFYFSILHLLMSYFYGILIICQATISVLLNGFLF